MLPFLLHFSVALVGAVIFSLIPVILPHIRHKNTETLPISRSEEYAIFPVAMYLINMNVAADMLEMWSMESQ
jgi:hypothetical protein